jgi:gliding motility-associated-like protein
MHSIRSSHIRKGLFLILICSVFQLKAQLQTIVVPVQYDAAIGYHDGYSTANNNYATAVQNAAYCIPGTMGGLNVNRALIRFDWSFLPECAHIVDARLDLYALGPSGTLSGHTIGNNEAILLRINQNWNINTVTWNNQPNTSSANQVVLASSTSATQDYLNIDVTQLVITMQNVGNYGFLLRQVNETVTRAMLFCSANTSNPSKFPILRITYDGCEDTVVKPDTTIIVQHELIIPNMFSPNNDGVNDNYFLSGNDMKNIHLTVLNRWGELIYEESGQEPMWLGKTASGENCSEGVYFLKYSVLLTDGELKEGQDFIHLIK